MFIYVEAAIASRPAEKFKGQLNLYLFCTLPREDSMAQSFSVNSGVLCRCIATSKKSNAKQFGCFVKGWLPCVLIFQLGCKFEELMLQSRQPQVRLIRFLIVQ